MNPWLAGALVVFATVLSDFLIVWLHRGETGRAIGRRTLSLLTLWFLLSFGFMAFLVSPH